MEFEGAGCFGTGVTVWSSGEPCSVLVCVILPGSGLRSVLASCSLHATAFRRRIREASLTRRLKRGSVARVRNVSLRILA